MKISLNWIKDFVDVPDNYSGEELGKLITLKTAEVEEVIDQRAGLDKIVVGEVKKIGPHPDADKLQVCTVFDGEGEHQVVCGAPNVYEGMKSPFAKIGAMVKWHGEGDLVEIKKAKVRGVESSGMLCAGEEIGVAMGSEDGIVDLKDFDCKAGDELADVIGFDDVIFDIDNKSLTHRPDLWGHYGFAREIASILNLELKPYEVSIDFPENGKSIDVEIQDSVISKRFCASTMSGIKVGESPDWMKQRLESVGVRSVNNIVDVTNYVMLEFGQPMHAYDRNVVGTDKMIVRFAKDGEVMETIDHKERKLESGDITIENGEEVLTVAGVMGGAKSEINDGTVDVILEAAHWDPVLVRQCSVRLGLRTDSSARFEKSLDPEMCPVAVARAAELIKQICEGAELNSPLVDVGGWNFEPVEVVLKTEEVEKKVGIVIEEEEIVRILKSLGFEVEGQGELKVTVPSWRATKDVDIKDDLVEEVARMYGYDQIPAIVPVLPTVLPMENRERVLKHMARRYFANILGYVETMTYSFYGKEDLEAALLKEAGHLQIENYLSEDQTHMRVSVVPNLLKCVGRNDLQGGELKMFEVGRTYLDEGDFFPLEEKWIVGVVVRPKENRGVGEEVFYEAKTDLEFFLEKFRAPSYKVKKSKEVLSYAHPSRSADLISKKKVLARVFELHPKVSQNFDLDDYEVGVFEINFTQLVALGQEDMKYQSVSKFPGIEFDVSVVIDKSVKVGELERLILEVGERKDIDFEISKVELFDIYQGENIAEGKKALAFRVGLQSHERTLTSDDMSKVQERVFEGMRSKGGEIRGA